MVQKGEACALLPRTQDLKTVKAALNTASILSSATICGGTVYLIDTVLLAEPLAQMPSISTQNVSAWFAGAYNASLSGCAGRAARCTLSFADWAAPAPVPWGCTA